MAKLASTTRSLVDVDGVVETEINNANAEIRSVIKNMRMAVEELGKRFTKDELLQANSHHRKFEDTERQFKEFIARSAKQIASNSQTFFERISGDEVSMSGSSDEAVEAVDGLIQIVLRFLAQDSGGDLDVSLHPEYSNVSSANRSAYEELDNLNTTSAAVLQDVVSGLMEWEQKLGEIKENATANEKLYLDSSGSIVGDEFRKASATVEAAISEVVQDLSASFSSVGTPSSAANAFLNGLENIYKAMTEHVFPLGKHVNSTILNAALIAHERYVAELTRTGKIIDSILYDRAAAVANNIGASVASALTKEDALRAFIERRTHNGYAGIMSDFDTESLDIATGTKDLQYDLDSLYHEVTPAKNAATDFVTGVLSSALSFVSKINNQASEVKKEIDADAASLKTAAASIIDTTQATDNITAAADAYLASIGKAGADGGDVLADAAARVPSSAEHYRAQANMDMAYLGTALNDLNGAATVASKAFASILAEFSDGSPIAALHSGLASSGEEGLVYLSEQVGQSTQTSNRDAEVAIANVGEHFDGESKHEGERLQHLKQFVTDGIVELDYQGSRDQTRATEAASWLEAHTNAALQSISKHQQSMEQGAYFDAANAISSVKDVRSLLRDAKNAVLVSGEQSTGHLGSQLRDLDGLMQQLEGIKDKHFGAIKENSKELQEELQVFLENGADNLTVVGSDLDALQAAEEVIAQRSRAAAVDAQADDQMDANGADDAKRISAARINIMDQHVTNLSNYMNESVAMVGDAVRSSVDDGSKAMTSIVDSIEQLVHSMSTVVNVSESNQREYQDNLETVEAFRTTNTHKLWINDNVHRAEMVDFLSSEFLQWVQRFENSDRLFKQEVRRKLEFLNVTIGGDEVNANKAARGAVVSEKDELHNLHTEFESNVEGKHTLFQEMVDKVHKNALAVLARVQSDDALQIAKKEQLRTLIMQKEKEIEGSINQPEGHAGGSTDSTQALWLAFTDLRKSMNYALGEGQNALSLERAFDAVASKMDMVGKVMSDFNVPAAPTSVVELKRPSHRVVFAVEAEKELADRDAQLQRLLASAVGS